MVISQLILIYCRNYARVTVINLGVGLTPERILVE